MSEHIKRVVLSWSDLQPGEKVYGPATDDPNDVFVIRNGQTYIVKTAVLKRRRDSRTCLQRGYSRDPDDKGWVHTCRLRKGHKGAHACACGHIWKRGKKPARTKLVKIATVTVPPSPWTSAFAAGNEDKDLFTNRAGQQVALERRSRRR